MSISQSLPSFAQAFSSTSLSDAPPISNALPPIHAHSPTTRKRSREERPPARANPDPHGAAPTRPSPVPVRIKEEDKDDSQHPSQSPPLPNDLSRDSSATPTVQPLSKKRRVTVTGAPRSSAEQTTPIPISPVISSFSLPDDALPRDQPRPILAKQQQKLPADQRRQSIASQGPMASGSILSASPPNDQLATSKLPRIGRASPSAVSVVNRCAGNAVLSGAQATPSSARPLTPPPVTAPQPPALTSVDPTSKQQQPAAAHSLAPPPISFARRRAAQSGGRKKKPADILISPRGVGPSDPLAPVIQSAPPVADPGRFQMAIPRLPLALNSAQTTRRVASNVPPTPTRFSLQGNATTSISSTTRTMHSPPNLSVPMSSTMAPPTPHALQHPGYSGDKPAFLAPFEVFYDALNDSKQLKSWLSDQLQKSNALMMSLKQQQEKMDELVEDLVEKRTRAMREEITMLRQRIESLEEAVLAVRAESSSTRGQDPPGYGYPQSSKSYQNGGPESTSSYRFPAPDRRRSDAIIRVTSPGREQEHQPSLSPPARRLSVSATAARPESPQATHNSFTLGGHSRRPSGSQVSVKCTPPMRPLGERSSTSRPADSRTSSRSYYLGAYGNGHPVLTEGQMIPRDGNKS